MRLFRRARSRANAGNELTRPREFLYLDIPGSEASWHNSSGASLTDR